MSPAMRNVFASAAARLQLSGRVVACGQPRSVTVTPSATVVPVFRRAQVSPPTYSSRSRFSRSASARRSASVASDAAADLSEAAAEFSAAFALRAPFRIALKLTMKAAVATTSAAQAGALPQSMAGTLALAYLWHAGFSSLAFVRAGAQQASTKDMRESLCMQSHVPLPRCLGLVSDFPPQRRRGRAERREGFRLGVPPRRELPRKCHRRPH